MVIRVIMVLQNGTNNVDDNDVIHMSVISS